MSRLGTLAVAATVALVVGTLLWLNLDSGIVSPEPGPRAFSLPLIGLGIIFGVRAWADAAAGTSRWTGFYAGLAAGVGGYGIVRLVL
jgi:hypothetical protein